MTDNPLELPSEIVEAAKQLIASANDVEAWLDANPDPLAWLTDDEEA